jgi:hypothetical protein
MADEIKNPAKAIRAFCLGCSGDSPSEVKNCPVEKCPLYPFRFGKNPYRQRRELTEEERQVLRDRLKVARENACSSAENAEVEDEE